MNRLPLTRTLLTTVVLGSIAVAVPRIARAQDEQPEQPAAETAPAEKTAEETAEMPRAKIPEGGADQKAGEASASQLRVEWGGYLKVIAEMVENDPASAFIGRNDGFHIGNARLAAKALYGDKLSAVISIEASVAQPENLNEANAELSVGPRDMYLVYDLAKPVALTLGRFKAPYDLGELEPEGRRVFIDRPLESRGVLAGQGFELAGMTQGRQIGVMLGREKLGLSSDGFDVGYALALTNGRTLGLALNDNDRPAGFARLSLYWSDLVQLNLAGFADNRTVGELPNLFDEDVLGLEGSLVVEIADLRVEGQLLMQHFDFTTSGAPSIWAMGFHAQFSYRFMGFEAAYRFALFDPNDQFEVDVVHEHTIGLSYYLESIPLRFTLNGTLAGEQSERSLENNRVALLSQFNF